MKILVLTETVFMIILRDVPWDDVIKLGAFAAAATKFWEWLQDGIDYISLIEYIKSSLTHLHGFQLLVVLPQFIEITFFICTNMINLLIVK